MEGGRKQLSDFERQVIILFKSENPTWGLTKCLVVLPNFFQRLQRISLIMLLLLCNEKDLKQLVHAKKERVQRNEFQMRNVPQ